MPKVLATITTSVDGYIAGPADGPGKGLGEGIANFRDGLNPKAKEDANKQLEEKKSS